MDTARQAVQMMGFPKILIDQIILVHQIEDNDQYKNVQELFVAVEEYVNEPSKETVFARKYHIVQRK